MVFGQTAAELKDVANAYGLGVAVLVAIAVCFILFVVVLARWIKPHADNVIKSHLETMTAFQHNSGELATCYKEMGVTIKTIGDNMEKHRAQQSEDRKEMIEMLSKIVDSNNGISKVVTNLSCLAGRIEKP